MIQRVEYDSLEKHCVLSSFEIEEKVASQYCAQSPLKVGINSEFKQAFRVSRAVLSA